MLNINQTVAIVRERGLKNGKKYFENCYTNFNKPWFSNSLLNRRQTVITNRCRASPYSLSASLARVGLVENAKCQCGNKNQDLNHGLWQCNLYDAERLELVKSLRGSQIHL